MNLINPESVRNIISGKSNDLCFIKDKPSSRTNEAIDTPTINDMIDNGRELSEQLAKYKGKIANLMERTDTRARKRDG